VTFYNNRLDELLALQDDLEGQAAEREAGSSHDGTNQQENPAE
jgi:hypothetical protein